MTKRLYWQLHDEATNLFPEECCGLVVGYRYSNHFLATRFAPSVNIHPTPKTNFLINPEVHFSLIHQLREPTEQDSIIGHYHSHPDTSPTPSSNDLAQINDPELLWLIISFSSITAWLPVKARKEFAQIPIRFV